MRSRIVAILVVLSASVTLARSASADEKKPSAGKAVFKPADQLKWLEMPGTPPGVKTAVLWGDPAKGPHGALHRFPAGFEAPLHHHTADYKSVVISGTMIVTPDGGAPMKMPPGSYGSFTGKSRHTTKCDAGSECTILVESKGAWDVVPEEPKK